jgi:L,D-peptidoglycan transpeptidase YkuD (ErfK/YbiS/YcfS/YnhG family)
MTPFFKDLTPLPDSALTSAFFQTAGTFGQLISVCASGSSAVLTMHQKRKNGWQLLLYTESTLGKNGIGKEKEGDWRTPLGLYTFTEAFGIRPDPGCSALPYFQVDDSMYWMADPASPSDYNTLISLRQTSAHGNLDISEHLSDCTGSYDYVLATSFNVERIPYAGSGIFLHCFNPGETPTAGCISVSEQAMVFILQNLQKDCPLFIFENSSLFKYKA